MMVNDMGSGNLQGTEGGQTELPFASVAPSSVQTRSATKGGERVKDRRKQERGIQGQGKQEAFGEGRSERGEKRKRNGGEGRV